MQSLISKASRCLLKRNKQRAFPLAQRYATERIHEARAYGQPLPRSHPHLFGSEGELTPGIPATEYEQRRCRLMDRLPDNAIAVCVGARLQYMSQSILCVEPFRLIHVLKSPFIVFVASHSFPFRQATDFAYLTGFLEPDAAVVLRKLCVRLF